MLTAIGREGSPVLRYRTHDITYLMEEPCPCGRSSRRIHRLIVEREGSMDTLTVEVEMSESTFSDEMRVLMHFERRVEADLKAALGIQASCVLVNPRTIERSEGKAKRVIDRREQSHAR